MGAAKILADERRLVIADRLVSREVLALVRGELRVARKLPGCAEIAQQEIYRWTEEAVRAGKEEGQGTERYANGSVYEGEWHADQKNGWGVCWFDGGDVYEGEWRENQREGRGTYWKADGDVFEGEWLEDKANGYGVYVH